MEFSISNSYVPINDTSGPHFINYNQFNFQTKFPNNEPRPHFTSKIENVTVNVGREAILECHVNNLGRYKVNISFFHNFAPEV